MKLDEEEPMFRQLHAIRHRIETTFSKTPTQIEGTMIDLFHLGHLIREAEDEWRIASTKEMAQVADDVSWWLSMMRERIEFLRGE